MVPIAETYLSFCESRTLFQIASFGDGKERLWCSFFYKLNSCLLPIVSKLKSNFQKKNLDSLMNHIHDVNEDKIKMERMF